MTTSEGRAEGWGAVAHVYLFFIGIVGAQLAAGCRYRDRLWQVETMSNVSNVVGGIERSRKSKGGNLSDQEAKAIIAASPMGHDAWGHPLVYAARGDGLNYHYVVIAPGSDGRLDFDDVARYFDLDPEDIRGRSSRDIVFRDGEVVTNAGN